MIDFKMSSSAGGGNSISVNNGNINYRNNSVSVEGDINGYINTGDIYGDAGFTYESSINWNRLKNDLETLKAITQMLSDSEIKKDLQETSEKLEDAVAKKDESSVWAALKNAGKGTLEFIKTLSLQVLPSLILKEFE